ncbi:GNAT family N-acetyltransferase [Neptunitalea lumnitzerae]|uniref:N-acetyltransferase n=1 Tax=Neptunitalea lumnitzerae TaxID=2965509 RepID=A0ABQ5MEM9_9FLAO|nr:GNAT family N-acetyltransferase [Neptunitalea sp. Y10]GLB47828.1 N-acetyltransferase [Neptunitalea sp. Y10]
MLKVDQPQLITERLVLRKLGITDWEVVQFLRSDSGVNRYVDRPETPTKEEAIAFIEKICDGIDNRRCYYWVLCTKDNPEMIGSICLWNFALDVTSAEVGYDLHPTHQGKGYMKEALEAICNFSFDILQLTHIEAYTHKDNIASRKLLEKQGFILQEGKTDPGFPHNIVYRLAP